MKSYLKKLSRMIAYHCSILLKGLIKMLWGTVLTAMIATAIYGFIAIPSEGGYDAVCDFLVSISTLGVALANIYLMGRNVGRGTKK